LSADASFPLTPAFGFAFAASFAGIAFTLASRNVRAKRVVFPVTVVVFHVMVFTLLRRAPAFAHFSPILIATLLAANAIQTLRIVRFCESCGRTMGMPMLSTDVPRCPGCKAALAQ
jgi:hypothetical protein